MKKAFTMIELLVVVLILGLLATIAVGVFTTQVERARFAAARSTISAIELAVNRYQLDLGVFPPSGSGLAAPSVFPADGCGFMQLAVMHSMSGTSSAPASKLWQGPYLNVKNELLGDLAGNQINDLAIPPPRGLVQILDPWHSPYRFVRSNGSADDNYTVMGGTELPLTHPYAATETYYNPSTFQVVSKGPNGTTLAVPNYGLDADDVTNFGL
jgi:prepilin-type N-terminal cleavage/methylation domain-containing protein